MVSGMSLLARSRVLALCALGACDRSIVLGARPDGPAVDAPVLPDDCSASIPEGLLAATPPMGWNGWNTFGCASELDEARVKATADVLVSGGMQAAGYQYLNLDDCWQVARAVDGSIVVNTNRFPNGIEPVSKYVHDKGLNFGLYSPTADCLGTPGSFGYEDKDAATYAAWNADYLKYRICSPPGDEEARYRKMAAALAGAGRAMVFSIASPPFSDWMARTGQLWRTGPSITSVWDDIVIALDVNTALAAWTRPGGFNDPDMLEVGNGTLTDSENRAHFTLWAIMSAPLLAGNDLTMMTETTRAILTNHEIIAMDQDPLGLQGALVRREGDVQAFAKPLASCGARGVVLFNRGAAAASIGITWPDIWLLPGPAVVRDLWAHADRAPVVDGITVSVPSHDVVALEVRGTEPPPPRSDAYLSDLPWTYVANGFGPVERDTSNGEILAGDGLPIRIRGRTYTKGLGAHGPSLIRYRLRQGCTRLTADVGVDDEVVGSGSVVFEVWADSAKLFDSGLMTGTTPARHVDVDLTGKRDLRLFIGTGGDKNAHDHGDWADAHIACGG
jgi:alpha-galactosidase